MERSVTEPFPSLKILADKLNHGMAPYEMEDVWDILLEETYVPDLKYSKIGIYHVGALESSERPTEHLAIGHRIRQPGEGRHSHLNALNMDDAIEASTKLRAFLKDTNLETRPVELLLTYYWSI